MTKYEVKDKLNEYSLANIECEILKKRIERLTANKVVDGLITERLESLTEEYKQAVLKADLSLAKVLEMINKLSNLDHDADVLKKYHIDGISEKQIARQLHLSSEYIKTKRWRAYEKLAKILEKS